MAQINRRHFIQQSAFMAAAVCGQPINSLAGLSSISEVIEEKPIPPDPAAVRKLASEIQGNLITTDQPEYESARLIFNRAFDKRPALIARCASASDVARIIDFARTRNLPLAVRGGGHSRAGFGVCDGGVVLDFSAMKRVVVDADARTAQAEAGTLVRDLDQATQRVGLATTSGGCPNVGIAGFTLGGGEGVLMSKYGAGCDNLLSAQVMTVDGRQLEASLQTNPDLFWAIRGGGGNFGVVTSFQYRLHPVSEVLAGTLTYSAQRIPDLLQAFAKFVSQAPDEMNLLGEFLPSANGTKFLIHAFYSGDPHQGNQLLAPLRTPIKPLQEDLRSLSYFEAQAAGFVPAPFAHFQTNSFVPEFNNGAIDAIATAVSNPPPQFRLLIVVLSGAITRVPLADTAFPLRRPGFEVDILGSWNSPSERTVAVQWVKALRDSLKPFAHGAYVNQLGETSEQLVRTAYGPNYARLAEIKRRFDPTNVLKLNQNIVGTF